MKYLKGNRPESAETTDRMEWRTGRRKKGTSWRDTPQHAPLGTRGQGGGEGEEQEPALARTPRPAESAANTPPGHCNRKGSSSTQC